MAVSESHVHPSQALELGDAVCLFPEGKSRYHPAMAPFKTGGTHPVSRRPDSVHLTFTKLQELSRMSCLGTGMTQTSLSIFRIVPSPTPIVNTGGPTSWSHITPQCGLLPRHVYIALLPGTHNSSLRQDNPELLKPIDYANIRKLTENMRRQISQGTVDAPSWGILRSAKCAANIYAPLGTRMSLGDYVRLVKAYIDVFGLAHAPAAQEDSSIREEDERIRRLCADLKVIQAHFPFVRLTHHHVGVPRSARALERER